MSLDVTEAETVTRVVGRGPEDLADAARRLATLREIGHPSVGIPDEIQMTPDGVVVATMPRVRGEAASVLARLRGGLSPGECVAIGVDVATALAALHSRGLAHGDVSPANIIASPTRAVLVDTLSGARENERGTVGFAAPERAVGATPAGDVYSLGRVLEALVGEDGRERIAAWAEPMCRPNPGERPSAEVAARALRECADPIPVSIPEVSIAAAVRARAMEPERPTVRLPDGRPWRIRRAVTAWARRVCLAAAGFLALLMVLRVVGAVLPDRAGWHYVPTLPMPAEALASAPDDAAAALVETRIVALAASDPEALLSATTEDGSAREADRPLADRLASGDLRYEGLVVEVASSETLSTEGNGATVRVSYQTTGHLVWDGGQRIDVPATSAVIDLDITWADGGWRIERTRARP
ncbi:MAG: hypothetical protein JW722_07770 [Demequinaceae bacterium]|nr:hypothetical protein [Demequinaceae bacterium]